MSGLELYPDAERSEGAQALHSLVQAWELAQNQQTSAGNAWESAHVGPLAAKLVAHRDVLFATNARLLAESTEGDANSDAQIAANQAAIKVCTALLGEMTFALGRSSIKP